MTPSGPHSHHIFVFGSNLKGRHGKGAALHAVKHYSACEGVGYGPQGHAYAIPTKGYALETLPLSVIERHVGYFITCVNYRDNVRMGFRMAEYNVTQIGCGLAGYTAEQIAPMFKPIEQALNVWFDKAWEHWLPQAKYWESPI